MSNTRIKLALDNWDSYVTQLASMPDRELEKKLDLIHILSERAEVAKNSESLELLEIWQRQAIEARTLKAENNIPDAPNEIELAIASIETTAAKAEERKEIIENILSQTKVQKSKMKEDDQNQLSMF